MFSQWTGRPVEIPIFDGDCRRGSHLFLALVAYPEEEDCEKRAAFCNAALASYARRLKKGQREEWLEINARFGDVLKMPTQQARNVLRMGMRRVSQRLVAAVVIRRHLLSTPAGLKCVLNSDGALSELRIVSSDDPLARPPSMTRTIVATIEPFGDLIPMGDRNVKGVKNIQDRIVRVNLPVAHFSHALLMRLSRRTHDEREDGAGRVKRWQDWLLEDPSWTEEVVPAAMNSRDALWLMCRESGLIFPPEQMISITLAYRRADAAA